MGFFSRLGLLIALMAAIALIDRWRHGASATRWREYSFLAIAGLLGAFFAIANDHLTATISREYFTIGKGLASGDHFRWAVTGLGFQAGLGAGVVMGMMYLMANNPRPGCPGLPMRQLLWLAISPAVAAILLAPLGAWLAYRFDPAGFTPQFNGLLTPLAIDRFRIVWGIHLGLYAGGLLGAGWGVWRIRRRRRGGA